MERMCRQQQPDRAAKREVLAAAAALCAALGVQGRRERWEGGSNQQSGLCCVALCCESGV